MLNEVTKWYMRKKSLNEDETKSTPQKSQDDLGILADIEGAMS